MAEDVPDLKAGFNFFCMLIILCAAYINVVYSTLRKCFHCATANGEAALRLLKEIDGGLVVSIFFSVVVLLLNMLTTLLWSATHHALHQPLNLSYGRFQVLLLLHGLMLGFGSILLGVRITLALLSSLSSHLQTPQAEHLPLLYKSTCRVLDISMGLILASTLAVLGEALYDFSQSTCYLYLAFLSLATYHYIRTS